VPIQGAMRFPIILQHDATDCGPAALAMMAAWHGNRISLARLREAAGTDGEGATLSGLIIAARKIGFSARAVRATAAALENVELPAVAHWHEQQRHHYIVICSLTPTHAVIADPAIGRRTLPLDEFYKCWTGVLLLLKQTPDLRNSAGTQSRLNRARSLLSCQQHLVLDALSAAVLVTILGLASSFFIQTLVDDVIVLGQTHALNWLGLGMLAVVSTRTAFLGLRTHLLTQISQRIEADVVMRYHVHLLGLPLSFFSSRPARHIVAQLRQHCSRIGAATTATVLSVIVDSLFAILIAPILLYMNWRVTIIPLAILTGVVTGYVLLERSIRHHRLLAMQKSVHLETEFADTMDGLPTIKSLTAEAAARTRIAAQFDDRNASAYKAETIATLSAMLIAFGSGMSSLALLCAGTNLVLAGSMTVGQLMGLNTLLGLLLGPLERLSVANAPVQEGLIAVDRLADTFDADTEPARQNPNSLDRTVRGTIDFEDVTFASGSRQPFVRGFVARIEAGECVAIIGESGAGKTTVGQSLVRFHEPESGTIRVDGIDIRAYKLDCLRREVAYVPQDVMLFAGSIADNIRVAQPSATADEVHWAAQMSRIIPDGRLCRTLTNGERRRLAIARAFLRDAPILVLDEPSTSMDIETELAFETLLNHRRGRRTTIVISRRPVNVDRIIDLSEKRVRAGAPVA
jgi:ATP-binding cassette, subfamily C, bacteriocin exporter